MKQDNKNTENSSDFKESITKVAIIFPFLLASVTTGENKSFKKYREFIGINNEGKFSLYQPVDHHVIKGVTATKYLHIDKNSFRTTMSLCYNYKIDPEIVIWLN
jgi:hypothetical protein